MTDAWEQVTFDGARRAQARRIATWTPQQRLAWLEAAVLDAHRSGALAQMRARKQRRLRAAWDGVALPDEASSTR